MSKGPVRRLVSAAALCTAIFTNPTYSQEAKQQQSDAVSARPANEIEEIVVTATKRNESLTQVPIAISVFTEDAIAAAGITRAADFLSDTPNVTFIEDNAGEAYINIRGQTSVRNSDPNVAIVIDGVTLSSTKPFNSDLFDLQQIEVLKGPQSALYGRNAAAGAIVITTKQPGDEFEGHVIASRGSFNSTRISLGAGGPVTNALKVNVAGSLRDTDGPFTSETSGQKVEASRTDSGRMRLIYEPDDRLKVDFSSEGTRRSAHRLPTTPRSSDSPLADFPARNSTPTTPTYPSSAISRTITTRNSPIFL